MAAAAVCKRLVQHGTKKSGFRLNQLRGICASTAVNRYQIDSSSFTRSLLLPAISSPIQRFDCRRLSQLSGGKQRAFLVDTLALVRGLEAEGVPTKQAEAITAAITEVLNDSLENVSRTFTSKAEMQMSEMVQDANLSKFKAEVKSSQLCVTEAYLAGCSEPETITYHEMYAIYSLQNTLQLNINIIIRTDSAAMVSFIKHNKASPWKCYFIQQEIMQMIARFSGPCLNAACPKQKKAHDFRILCGWEFCMEPLATYTNPLKGED
ncbi:hypothetical protein GIB67_029192 [Kingdonia uniflora]|uniref:Uncharacterized protein n=1 Tax=Kingdonia uniflora TaxID=39325 RepID=A0A7J7LRZ3_9MAGN|nr:hypothetical protein GIB67_029192 [Kingdonia uniflora]